MEGGGCMNPGLKNVNKTFGRQQVFHQFSISFNPGKISCLLGSSGCGKTTLLNLLSGALKCDAGVVEGMNGKRVAYVFQEPRLLPWRTVSGNLEFVLPSGWTADQKDATIRHQLERVNLENFSDFYPGKLSGGMKQRVSLARAFAFPSDIILMDEPFRGLDPILKKGLMEMALDLWNEEKRTVIFVTHDLDEAKFLGEEIFILGQSPVKIVKHFDKDDLKRNPAALEEWYRNL